jgi:hypothetical protein
MRYRLRTLMIVLALGPPLIWGGVTLLRAALRPIRMDLCGKSPSLAVDTDDMNPKPVSVDLSEFGEEMPAKSN